MRTIKRFGLVSCGIVMILLFKNAPVTAQEQGNWSAPIRISRDGVRARSNEILADPYGYLHLFWIEENLAGNETGIYYSRFDGETWSSPIDIYTTSPIAGLQDLASTIDRNGSLHLIWSEGAFRQKSLFFSSASALNAASARMWSRPIRIDVPADLFGIKVDTQGVIHILYSKFFEPDPGVYYMFSQDKGKSWSDPVWLDPDIPAKHAPSVLQLAIDEYDGLHLTWLYATSDTSVGDWIRYTHKLNGLSEWSLPFTIDQDRAESGFLRVAGPIMTVQGLSAHVIWAGGEQPYRNHRFSQNLGDTWSVPMRIFGDLNGQAVDGFAVDGSGRIIFLGQIRYPQGIYESIWDNQNWTNPSLVYLIARTAFEPRGERIHAHYLRAAVRAGNQLVITFHPSETDQDGSLYIMTRMLSNIPLTASLPTPTNTPVTSPSPTQKTPAFYSTSVAETPQSTKLNLENLPKQQSSTLSSVFLISILPVLVMIGVTFFFLLLRKR